MTQLCWLILIQRCIAFVTKTRTRNGGRFKSSITLIQKYILHVSVTLMTISVKQLPSAVSVRQTAFSSLQIARQRSDY